MVDDCNIKEEVFIEDEICPIFNMECDHCGMCSAFDKDFNIDEEPWDL